jgi:hypothetical protein
MSTREKDVKKHSGGTTEFQKPQRKEKMHGETGLKIEEKKMSKDGRPVRY